MNQGLLNSLTETERLFVGETSAEALAGLDEDAVLELHARARRMRDKYVKNYRRAAGGKVSTVGGRGLSYETNQRARGKAEVFETALARVSRRLGALAAQSAAELRRERIEAAQRTPPGRRYRDPGRPLGGPAARGDLGSPRRRVAGSSGTRPHEPWGLAVRPSGTLAEPWSGLGLSAARRRTEA
jgi:hypothetical protein